MQSDLTYGPAPAVQSTAPSEPLLAAIRTVSAKVIRRDSLARLWVRSGGSYNGAVLAAKAFKKAGVSLSDLQIGETLELDLSPAGEIVGLRRELGEGQILSLSGNETSGYSSQVIKPRVIESELVVSGSISSNFSAAALQANVPQSLLDDFVDLFSGSIEFRKDFQPGDSFAIVYTRRATESGLVLDPGPIKAASLRVAGKFLAAVRYTGKDRKARYYDASGNPIGSYFLRYPVQFSRISSVFTDSRLHPILKVRRPHHGVDFSARIGTPVRTVGDGTVSFAGYRKDAGLMVEIKHNSRYSTAYLHLSKITPGIRKGAQVTRGQHIGGVGMTGLTSGPHLHFSLYEKGVYVDPLKVKLPLLLPDSAKVPPKYLKAVLATLQQQHRTFAVAAVVPARRPRARRA